MPRWHSGHVPGKSYGVPDRSPLECLVERTLSLQRALRRSKSLRDAIGDDANRGTLGHIRVDDHPDRPGWNVLQSEDVLQTRQAHLRDKQIEPRIALELPLAKAREANERIERGGIDGKIVLVA